MKIIISFLVLFFSVHALSQEDPEMKSVLEVTIRTPQPDQLHLSDLFTVQLVNKTSKNLSLYLTGSISIGKDIWIVVAETRRFTIASNETLSVNGEKLLEKNSIKRKDEQYFPLISTTGKIPEGNYTVCVIAKLVLNDTKLGSNCITHTVVKDISKTNKNNVERSTSDAIQPPNPKDKVTTKVKGKDLSPLSLHAEQCYVTLTKKLDGGYFRSTNNKLSFVYNKEYGSDEMMNYIIYNSYHHKVQSNYPDIQCQRGLNFVTLDLNSTSDLEPNGWYTLEVSDEKNSTFMLRFQYIQP